MRFVALVYTESGKVPYIDKKVYKGVRIENLWVTSGEPAGIVFFDAESELQVVGFRQVLLSIQDIRDVVVLAVTESEKFSEESAKEAEVFVDTASFP